MEKQSDNLKTLTEQELGELIQRICAGAYPVDPPQAFQGLLLELGAVVARYCGGVVHSTTPPNETDSLGWCIHFQWAPTLPPDGGVFADFDPDMSVEKWMANAPSTDRQTRN